MVLRGAFATSQQFCHQRCTQRSSARLSSSPSASRMPRGAGVNGEPGRCCRTSSSFTTITTITTCSSLWMEFALTSLERGGQFYIFKRTKKHQLITTSPF